MSSEQPQTVLVIFDANFKNLCADPVQYMSNLTKILKDRLGEHTELVTVEGRFGYSCEQFPLNVLEIEDRNRTLFVQTIENHANSIDQLQIVSLADNNSFFKSAADALSARGKTIARFSYKRSA